MKQDDKNIETAYRAATESYAALGVDAEAALAELARLPLSLHCWQGDDVAGFENPDAALTGGIQATGNYPGKARTPAELRADFAQALALIPGRHRINLHSIYAETGGRKIPRDELEPSHFAGWMAWAKELGLGMDFNPSFFSHPLAADGFTLSHRDAGVRNFWIRHGQACRRIGAALGESAGSPCVTNVWIPDGYKDTPFDRAGPRGRLRAALDEVFAEPLPTERNLDAVESKLFGIGSESYVTGSHEFYLGYAVRNRKLLCLDSGHFHPTEAIGDKISSCLLFLDGLLLHLSRGVRWDSDHVVTLGDELCAAAQEIVRGGCTGRVRLGLDFFDASINRVAAWVIGARAALKALLLALLEPRQLLREAEANGDYTARLALLEESKSLPFAAVWDFYCLRFGAPAGAAWLEEVRRYERATLAARRGA